MAAIDNFRSSLHGFNRTDVVQFIQQQTAAHDKALRTLKDENTRLQEALTEARAELESLKAENEALFLDLEAARLASSEEKEAAPIELPTPAVEAEAIPAPIIEAKPVIEEPIVVPTTVAPIDAPKNAEFNELELLAYRRAEMTERMARERAAASAQRMKTIFSQVDEKLTVSAGDIATVIDSFQKDCDQLQLVLAEIRGIVDESSSGLKAVSDLCNDI